MTTLADLIADLQTDVPAVNSVPTTAQYEKAVKDAVNEFSRRCGLVKIASLNIVSGTATYDLADDFLKLILLESPVGIDGVIISASGIIPLGESWDETYQVVAGQITFFPTPTYTMTRDYRYKAAWILTGDDGSETYADMRDEEAQIVLLKAKALATEKIMNAQASKGSLRYSFGAVSVDKSSGLDSLGTSIEKHNSMFDAECKRYNGAVIA